MAAAFAGVGHRPGASPFTRVEALASRVYLVVENDRFYEFPYMYVIIGSARIVLIDTGVGTGGSDSYAKWLRTWLSEENSKLPILVINTHCHFDHVGGNAGLESTVAATIAASGHNRDFTSAALDPQRDASLAKMVECTELAPYEVAKWLDDRERIRLNREDETDDDGLVVLHTPGHTPDSLCLYLERERILFVGDTIYPHAPIILANKDSGLNAFKASIASLIDFVREQEEKPPSASDCGAVDSAAAAEEEEDADGAEPNSKRSRQAVASSSSSTRQPITLACGHIAEALALSALDEVQSLVDDVVAKRIAPRSKGVDYGSVRVLFERGNYSLSMRPDMCACE